MAEATFHFPKDFKWGTATAAHQVEGDNTHSDWWAWEQDGAQGIYQNQPSGKACGWWEGYAEKDIRRMKDMRTNAHRMGIEWSRIEPKPGKWDLAAIDRYREILTAMRKAGIEPMVTLHHFTNPQWLAERGGWLNEETPSLFRKFAMKAVGELGDLCNMWCTINEPTVYAANAFFEGRWIPKHKSLNEYFQVVGAMLDAHGLAYHAIHEAQPQAQVGLAHHMVYFRPRRPAYPLDRMVNNLLESFFNNGIIDAIRTGTFKPLGGKPVEMTHLKDTLDWFGLNYYQRYDSAFSFRVIRQLGITYAARPDMPKGPGMWGELFPEGLFTLIMHVHRTLGKPIRITENGVPDQTDMIRPGYMLEHLRQVWRAIQFNVPVMAYYWWSLVDNFEWVEAYNPEFRFGLFTMDFRNQRRSMTKSAELYKEIASSYSVNSDMAKRYAPDVADRLFPGDAPPQGA